MGPHFSVSKGFVPDEPAAPGLLPEQLLPISIIRHSVEQQQAPE
jgi:hypothetical protein